MSFQILLGYLDSNQEKQDQNLLCYHYTIAQNVISILLGYLDSNQEKQDQNLLCYHYTIAQNVIVDASFLFRRCKGTAFFKTYNLFPIFFLKK